MKTRNYIEKMKNIQEKILNYIDSEENVEENYQNLVKLFDDNKIRADRYELKSILYLLAKISDNHHRYTKFFDKINQILNIFKDEIKKYYSNTQIFNIFSNNKRLLLLLIEENLLTINEELTTLLTTKEYNDQFYKQYLFSEIKPFISEKMINDISKTIPEDFEQKRKIGENDNYICELMRKDDIEEFIIYVKKNNLFLKTKIESSLFETNCCLLENHPSLIEYAAFFGSAQIFRYLHLNKVNLTPSLWTYAIHGRNPEIISYLEEKKVHPKDSNYENCLDEAIKCHHNDVFNYIQSNILVKFSDLSEELLSSSIEYYNYYYFNNEFKSDSLIIQLCRNDYFNLLVSILNDTKFDVNKRIISLILFLILFLIYEFNKISKYIMLITFYNLCFNHIQ